MGNGVNEEGDGVVEIVAIRFGVRTPSLQMLSQVLFRRPGFLLGFPVLVSTLWHGHDISTAFCQGHEDSRELTGALPCVSSRKHTKAQQALEPVAEDAIR
jgi:hypothetical protein